MRRLTTSTRHSAITGTTPTIVGRSGAFANWWETVTAGERRPYQAPVSYRILPRMLGQARRAASLAAEVAEESLQAVTDNPVWVDDVDEDHPFGRFVTSGGYHNPHAVLAMDALTAAWANLCVLAERHGAKLLDGAVSLLPHQLNALDADDDAPRAYLGCLPMAQTGYEEEARLYAQATVLPGSESGGFGQNDVASPVFLAWSKQDRAGRCLDMALASLVPIALRALDVTDRPVPPQLADLEDRGPRNLCSDPERRAGLSAPWWPRLRAPCRATSIHPDALRSAANVLSRRPALPTMRVQPPGGEERAS